MSYTLLRVDAGGVMLASYHLRRLSGERAEVTEAFWRFAAAAEPGVWALRSDGGALLSERRGPSRLRDGMPVRMLPSPLMPGEARLPKPASPSRYDGVRCEGTATLLTSPDGGEILEACSAAVLGWDGRCLVCVPAHRPRVLSTAEAAVREHLPFREDTLAARSAMPLILVNAVKGTCPIDVPGRAPFPAEVRQELERLFAALTLRAC